MIWTRGGSSVVQAMAQRGDVAHLYANPQVKLDEPTPLQAYLPPGSRFSDTVEWNIAKVRAPEVWALGYTGQGAVIAGQDTGYYWQHPALMSKYRGWMGSAPIIATTGTTLSMQTTPYQLRQPVRLQLPCAVRRRLSRTHTMGTMVGDDGPATRSAWRPGRGGSAVAIWSKAGYPATYAECYQWFIAPLI